MCLRISISVQKMNGIVYKPTNVSKLIDPLVDVGNLLIIDRDPLDGESNNEGSSNKSVLKDETVLLGLARNNTQYLFNEIWKLPRKNVDQTICAQLPAGTYALPREKPIPEKRQPTKWETFARAKGIVKKNKDRKVFDETTKEWKPRYGYRRASNDVDNKEWLIEVPRQKDPYKDYFDERQQNKRDKTDKYEYQRLKNVARSLKPTMPRHGANSTPLGPARQQMSSANAADLHTSVKRKEFNKRESQELTNQMYRAKTSTASAGKFQNAIRGEKKPKLGEKRKFEPNEANTISERQHQLELLSKLQAKKPKLDATKFNALNQKHEQEQERDFTQQNGRKRNLRQNGHKRFNHKKNEGKSSRTGRDNKKNFKKGAKPNYKRKQ